MAKKDRHLISLSWEHRNGLVLVWRVRRGLEKGVDRGIIAAYLLHFWDIAVRPHFETEEKLLFPEMAGEESILAQVRGDHQAIREMVDVFRNGKRPKQTIRSLQDFSDALERHIRFEEREVFPVAAKRIPPERMKRLDNALHARFHNVTDNWSPEFWETG